jgi:transcriptional regulator with XRE-family HTH domain
MFRNLKGEIVRAGLTQEKFADEIGISRNTMSNKLKGKHPFNLVEIKKILEYFKKVGSENVNVEYLFLA